MTTAQKPKQSAKEHNDWAFGPVAAPVVAGACAMFLATIGRLTGGIAPWMPLAGFSVMAVVLVFTGMHRRPRRLSTGSLIYRSMAMITAGGWMWSQLATFRHVDLTPSQVTALSVGWLAVAVFTLAGVWMRRLPTPLRVGAPALALLFAAVLTLAQAGPVFAWLHDALLVTSRMPHGVAAFSWAGQAVLTLVSVTAPTAVIGLTFATRERSADEEAEAAAGVGLPKTPGGAAKEFRKLICTMTREITDHRPADPTEPGWRTYNLGINEVRFWPNGAGETYIVDLTANKNGTTADKLAAYKTEVATKLNLPEGCGMEVLPAKTVDGKGMGRGFAAVDISRVNVLEQTIEYPPIRQRSILNPLPLGQVRSGREIGPHFRESSCFLWGQKGSGKTGTVYDIVAGALQCTDCLVWIIDLNKGNAARPFLRAFGQGKVNRPCVDWVATTLDEVVRMAEVGKEIALARKNFYTDLKFEQDTNLMPIGNGGPGQPPPEILIVIDEGATVLGLGGDGMTPEGKAARETLQKIMDLARDAAVNIVFSGLRATADVADTAFKAGTSIRIGMRVTDSQELAYGFNDYNLSGEDIPYAGSGFIKTGHDNDGIQVFKAYYLAPRRMAGIGEEVTPWRPYLDELSLRVAGSIYANRWRRTAPALWDDPLPEVLNYGSTGGRPAEAAGPAIPAATATAVAVMPGSDDYPVLPMDGTSTPTVGGGFQAMMSDVQRMKAQMDAAAAAKAAAGGEDPPPAAPTDQATGGPTPPPADLPAGRPAGAFPKTTAEFDQIFQGIAAANEPRMRPVEGMTVEQELAQNPSTRDILERIVLIYGPIRAKDLYAKLRAGGDHGPAVDVSYQTMNKLLKKSDGEPVDWLAPRAEREPYTHVKNASM